VTNLGAAPVRLPAGDVLVSSGPLTDEGLVPTDTTAWLRLPVA
jgi:alpha-glucosidase